MKERILKKSLFIIFLVVLLMIVISIMIKYDVEGEKKLPFSISKILVVSTVDGKLNEDTENIWNIGVTQVNDLYLYVDKTIKDDEQTIKEIKIENFVINKAPNRGKLKVLRPTGEIANLYTHSHQDYLNDKIVYTGGVIDDLKSLEISNNGGILGFRISVEELGNYISNEDETITYDGKLLSNLGVTVPEIEFNVNFDVIITTSENISFKGTINLSLPIDTVIEEGSSNKEITDFSDVVFKRI
ncbi:MAG: hypothetical protein IKL55_01125 [Clostridia bacterium]|nr:hypothetical protein [Clostridia bacterium]